MFRWRRADDGDLRLSVVEAEPDDLPYAETWVRNTWDRIGDLPQPGVPKAA